MTESMTVLPDRRRDAGLPADLGAGLRSGVATTNPITILAVAGVTPGAATLACWIPARQVAHTSLLRVLRYE